jgi:ATP-dependent helicase HrpA
VEALKQIQAQPTSSRAKQRQTESFRWMVEEFKVSLFAQELGTAVPVSPKRLDQQLEIVRQTA